MNSPPLTRQGRKYSNDMAVPGSTLLTIYMGKPPAKDH